MRVLIVGGGGREHALAWALSTSPLLDRLWVAPGNPGTAMIAENVAIGVLDLPALVDFAVETKIDLVVPGPEAPLVAGLADALARAGIRCCGPSAAAAQLEGSKAFAKTLADAAGIPTARWEAFTDAQAARDFVERRGAPVVVKADGLAAGKGVVVAATGTEALAAIDAMMTEKTLGDAGSTVIVEECLDGDEISLFALCDGTDALLLGAAQDHKRIGDGDVGPNTGGMGAVSPPAGFPREAQAAALDVFIRPALAEMARRGTPFRGILFAGLMLTADGPKLIEYNVRFGDPEAQTLLPRLGSDLLPALLAACDGELGQFTLIWREVAAISVVLAARGYPGAYETGHPIGDLTEAEAEPHVAIFHAGTDLRDGVLVGSGGRVLTVCATGLDSAAARRSAYAAISKIHWPEGVFRRDIGVRSLARERAA